MTRLLVVLALAGAATGDAGEALLSFHAQWNGVPVALRVQALERSPDSGDGLPWRAWGRVRAANLTVSFSARLDRLPKPDRAQIRFQGHAADLAGLSRLLQRPLPDSGPLRFSGRLRLAGQGHELSLTAGVTDVRMRELRIGRADLTLAGAGREPRDLLLASRWRLLLGAVSAPALPEGLEVREVWAGQEAGGAITVAVDGRYRGRPLSLDGRLPGSAALLAAAGEIPVQLRLALPGAELGFAGALGRTGPPSARGRLHLRAEDLDVVADLLDIRAPPRLPLRGSARVDLAGRRVALTGLSLSAGPHALTGRVDYRPGPRGGHRLRLELAAVDLQLPSRSPAEAGTRRPAPRQVGKEAPTGPDGPGPLAALGRIPLPTPPPDLDLRLRVERLRLLRERRPLAELSASLVLTDGRLSLAPAGGTLLGGPVALALTLEPGARASRLWLWVHARGLDYGRLLADLGVAAKAEVVTGRLDLDGYLRGNGEDLATLLHHGDGQLRLRGGGGRLPRRLLELWGGGLFQSLAALLPLGQETTAIDCALARLRLRDGVLLSQRLLLDTETVRIAGWLRLDLASGALSGLLHTRGQGPRLQLIPRPVRIAGSLARPEVELAGSPLRTLFRIALGLENPLVLALLAAESGAGEDPCAGDPD